jgi:hypothetical protein
LRRSRIQRSCRTRGRRLLRRRGLRSAWGTLGNRPGSTLRFLQAFNESYRTFCVHKLTSLLAANGSSPPSHPIPATTARGGLLQPRNASASTLLSCEGWSCLARRPESSPIIVGSRQLPPARRVGVVGRRPEHALSLT